MVTPAVPPEELQKTLDCWHRNGRNQSKTAIEMAMSRMAIQSRLKKAQELGLSPAAKDNIPFGHEVRGVSTLYNRDGEEILTWVKTSKDVEAIKAAIVATIDALKLSIPKESKIKRQSETIADLLSCYVVTDYHMGQLSWGEETGADWDLKIAENLLVKWFAAAIESAPDSEVGIFAQLGDLLHADGILAITPTSGNILDADTRFAKLVETVIRVLRRIINMLLEKHEKVHIVMAEGNHDISSSIWLRALFAEKYADNKRVTIDTTHAPYYAFEWGETSLFFHHGHKRKMSEISEVFAGLYREIYGRTKYSYGHMGHMHHAELKENQMMIVEQHPTLAAMDAHSARAGYKSQRGATAITYHKKYGEVSRSTIRPEMVGLK